MSSLKQVPLTCGGHTRPVVHLDFSDVTDDGYYLISACKGEFSFYKYMYITFKILNYNSIYSFF